MKDSPTALGQPPTVRVERKLSASTPEPGPRRLHARFPLYGRWVRFSVTGWAAPPADAPWRRSWLELARPFPFCHVQQAGLTPTFVGVAATDPTLGRHFVLELLGGGWCWRELIRAHTLILLDHNQAPRVFYGARLRPHPGMVDTLTHHVLPAAQAALQSRVESEKQRQAAASALAKRKATQGPCSSWDLRSSLPEAVAAIERGGCQVFVRGALEQSEAAALAGDLAAGHLWQPARHGDLLLEISANGPVAILERPDPAAARALAAFAAGYCRQVVIADLHLGRQDRDTFGGAKLPALLDLLDEVIAQRSVLVLNGDFLELMHERYGEIKRSYAEIFERLPRVRRVIYVAGNHDDDILQETIKETRRACRRVAGKNAFAEVTLGLCDEWLLSALPGHGLVPHRRRWLALVRDPRLQPALVEILKTRRGSFRLSRGFREEAVAFQRRGMRGTPDERPQWHIDEHVVHLPDPAGALLRLMADRRQRLDRVITADWGGRVEIVRHYWHPGSGCHFEHGHFAVPSCHGSRLGRHVSVAAGWAKRLGFTGIEEFFEERIGGLLRAIYPHDVARECRRFIQRTQAVGQALRALAGRGDDFTIVCSHTHEPVCCGSGPVHHFLQALTGGRYANTGAWSSRLRRRQGGATSAEWLEIEATGQVVLRRIDLSERDPLLEPTAWTAGREPRACRPAAATWGAPASVG